MQKGLFITFEGTDGSGKTTQINKLAEFLKSKGKEIIITREPGGTKISEKIREIILDKENSEMDYITETMLYAAARAQLVAQVIKPALEDGKTVICDRFLDSSIAYQGYGRELGNVVAEINEYGIKECTPNKTFFLKVNPEIGKKRITGELDRLEREKKEYHRRVFNGYLQIEREDVNRVVTIDGEQSIDDIFAEIKKNIEGLV